MIDNAVKEAEYATPVAYWDQGDDRIYEQLKEQTAPCRQPKRPESYFQIGEVPLAEPVYAAVMENISESPAYHAAKIYPEPAYDSARQQSETTYDLAKMTSDMPNAGEASIYMLAQSTSPNTSEVPSFNTSTSSTLSMETGREISGVYDLAANQSMLNTNVAFTSIAEHTSPARAPPEQQAGTPGEAVYRPVYQVGSPNTAAAVVYDLGGGAAAGTPSGRTKPTVTVYATATTTIVEAPSIKILEDDSRIEEEGIYDNMEKLSSIRGGGAGAGGKRSARKLASRMFEVARRFSRTSESYTLPSMDQMTVPTPLQRFGSNDKMLGALMDDGIEEESRTDNGATVEPEEETYIDLASNMAGMFSSLGMTNQVSLPGVPQEAQTAAEAPQKSAHLEFVKLRRGVKKRDRATSRATLIL
jgi:hypothetical protein